MAAAIVFLCAATAFPALLPDDFGTFKKSSSRATALDQRPLWEEYGFEESEQAEYSGEGSNFTVTAYRLQDSTGALGVFQWKRPPGSPYAARGAWAVTTADGVFFLHGNYVIQISGRNPPEEEIDAFLSHLPRVDLSGLAAFIDSLPRDGLVAGSERYVIGPAALAAFERRIPPSVAAFHLAAEAQFAHYKTPKGEMDLLVFSYPTPHAARSQMAEFTKLPGAMAKRTGPLVAVILSPPDRDEAERLLSKVRYQAVLTWNEYVPTSKDNVGNLIINSFIFVGVMLLFGAVSGLVYAGFRALSRRMAGQNAENEQAIVSLRLSDE